MVVKTRRRWLFAILLVASSTGCASTRPAATMLASQGGAASRTIEAAFAKTEADLDLMVDRRLMQAALTGREPLSSQALSNIERVQNAMIARRRLCGDLAALYDNFAALAAYDASTEVAEALERVTASTNTFALAVGDSAVISAPAGDLVGRLASALATKQQNDKLRKTSAVIRESLSLIRRLVTHETYVYQSARGEIERRAGDAALELWRNGLGKPHPLLRELLDDHEFSYDEGGAERALRDAEKSARIREGIEQIVKRRVIRRVELEIAAVAGFASILGQLEEEHRAFEAKQPLDLRGLTERLAAFREIVDLITAARRPRVHRDELGP